MFEPSLIEVPVSRPLAEYRAAKVPILDQGQEGACTGYGLATVVHYLLRTRRVVPDGDAVSPRMLYDMARRYDEWPGEKYEGSSARGAMKGWHKHGVCSARHWQTHGRQNAKLFTARFEDAYRRPLGAYLRVNHKDVVAMHSAISEVGILYATANVHSGWDDVGADGVVRYGDKTKMLGGHAFAIVAYDEHGLWIQNSWGRAWGCHGFGRVSYDDWLANGSDVWVARLGAPIVLTSRESAAHGVGVAAQGSRSYVFCDLRPHIISLGNNGALRTDGTYGTSEADVEEIFGVVARQAPARPHLLLYAHGGLVGEDSAIQKIADLRAPMLNSGVYPISLIWKTDFWTTLKNILDDAIRRRRPEGVLDATKDFMLDRLDDALEPLARIAGGKAQWDEMKENAVMASQDAGGLVTVAGHLAALSKTLPALKLHIVGHSAGSILLAPLVSLLRTARYKVPIATCTLWAPACTVDMYREHYLPAVRSRHIGHFSMFTLTDKAERDDNCGGMYHKSLLYLVSNAFERTLRKPFFGQTDGEALLGLEKFAARLGADTPSDWVRSPNAEPEGASGASRSISHGGFDDDAATLKATLTRIAGAAPAGVTFTHHRSASVWRARRAVLARA